MIAEVGPGGSFMVHPHTVKRMKTTALLPSLADRNARAQWESKGALDTHARALAACARSLPHANPAGFSGGSGDPDSRRVPGLGAGELQMPEAW